MNAAELDGLLRNSLIDLKLSGCEKDALLGWVQAHVGSDQDRAVARSRVFDVARTAAPDDTARQLIVWLEVT